TPPQSPPFPYTTLFRSRELYSGWNCVARNQGWSRNSTISTSHPSGESPLSTNPLASNCSRYALLNSYRCRWRSRTSLTPYIFWRSEEHTSELQSRGHLV